MKKENIGMKKILTFVLVLLVLVGCNKTEISTVDKIKEKGELVLLTEATFPPFEYGSNAPGSVDGIAGVDIEFGKALAEKLGVTLKVVDMDFDSLTVALQAGKGDLIAAGMTATPEHAEIVDFSNIYFDNGLFIIVPEGSDIKSAADLSGKKVAVQQGTTGNDFADKIDGAEVLTFGGMLEAGIAVVNGNADASVMDVLTAQIIVHNNPSLVLLDNAVESEETAIAVQKGNDSLMAVVNELLDELQTSGQLQTWFDEHFEALLDEQDRKSTRLNSSHVRISY